MYWDSCFFDQLWFYFLKWKHHSEIYEYSFRFINNRKRYLTARSQDYLPIGSHKNKFILWSQNLLIFFENFCKRKFHEFPEFWGNFWKFILRNKEFSPHTKVYTRNFFRFFGNSPKYIYAKLKNFAIFRTREIFPK